MHPTAGPRRLRGTLAFVALLEELANEVVAATPRIDELTARRRPRPDRTPVAAAVTRVKPASIA